MCLRGLDALFGDLDTLDGLQNRSAAVHIFQFEVKGLTDLLPNACQPRTQAKPPARWPGRCTYSEISEPFILKCGLIPFVPKSTK